MFESNKNEIDIHYILNEKLCSELERPVIVQAVKRNNIEIVETLLSKQNGYKVRCLYFCFVCFGFLFLAMVLVFWKLPFFYLIV